MSSLILVGQAPSRSGDPGRPLEGAVGQRLASMMGLGLADYLSIERVNLLDRWPGTAGAKGDAFPMVEARAAAARLAPRLAGRRVVVVGVATARAMGAVDQGILRWGRSRPDGSRLFILPHPSGVNRWWNSFSNRVRARRSVRRALGLKALGLRSGLGGPRATIGPEGYVSRGRGGDTPAGSVRTALADYPQRGGEGQCPRRETPARPPGS